MKSEVKEEKAVKGGKRKKRMMGYIENVRVPFSADVGLDDVIVPEASLRRIATRLEGFEEPEIYTFSVESTITEKFDAILDRMETTSRIVRKSFR